MKSTQDNTTAMPDDILNQLAAEGPPTAYTGAKFRRAGNLIYNLRPTTSATHPFENDVAINVVAHHLPAEQQNAIVEELMEAANRAFCPEVEAEQPTHLLIDVHASGARAPLVAFWQEYKAGYTTSLKDAALLPRDFALKVESEACNAVAIPLTDIGHRLTADGDVVPFTGDNASLLLHLLEVSNRRAHA